MIDLSILIGCEITIEIKDSAIVIGFRRQIQPAVGFQFFNAETGEQITMLTMKYNQQVDVSIKPVDAAGNAAKVDGVPKWSLSVPDFAHLANIAADGLKATLVGDKPGTFQVNVKGDADLGAGVKEIVSMLDVELLAGEAVGFEMQTGSVTDQPPTGTTAKKK